MPTFIYDYTISMKDNFLRWYDMNTFEKSAYGEEPYTWEQATKVFESIHPHVKKIATS